MKKTNYLIIFTIDRSLSDTQGLFGRIFTGGIVKNVALLNVNIIGGTTVGSVTGANYGVIQNCFVTGNVSGRSSVGGVAGANGGTIENCYTTCNVVGRRSFPQNLGTSVGGVLGYNREAGIVQNCYSTGSITGSYDLGGVVGDSNGTIKNCVALNKEINASVSIPRVGVGCVVGLNATGTLTNNYARETGMIITSNNVNVNVGENPTASSIHGANTSSANYNGTNSGAWWGSSSAAPGFNAAYWSFANNHLPWLLGFPNLTQTPTVIN